jgi:catechol 2,3-dioxygenase-like lactoylglutathione lyase family enzyme
VSGGATPRGSSAPCPSVSQLAFCTPDLPGSLRLYSEVFGFADAGVRTFWGEWLARVQKLGADAACSIGWLVGRQDMVQLEFFHHTLPPQQPLAPGWRPSDDGWSRFGIAVPDFDAALERLRERGVAPSAPVLRDGLRRVCFRDPFTHVYVELLEEGASMPGGVRPRFFELAPAVVYAAVTVADLERSRRFFVETVGLREEDPRLLHTAADEELWGLPGARAERFVVSGGGVFIEVSRYDDPIARPKPAGYRLSDQGFMNVAVGFRDRPSTDELVARIVRTGTS